MTKVTTEQLHQAAEGIDARPAEDVAKVLVEGQVAAAQVVRNVSSELAAAAKAMAQAIRSGGSVYYVAAGSSGLMGAADAMELGGTFGVSADQVRIVMAGGVPTTAYMPGDVEDLAHELDDGFADLAKNDVIVAISASGSTPFTMEAVRRARAVGATIIGVANNAQAPMFELSDHEILLATPPEVLSGSTRMGAGTAQKIALNAMSTLMAMELGHIYNGMMVNLRIDNAKLQDRARRIVSAVADVSDDEAGKALEVSKGDVKVASLIAAGARSVADATDLLDLSAGQLRPALDKIRDNTGN